MSAPDSAIVSPDWLAAMAPAADLVIADVRPAIAYAQAHIPGAISVDLGPARLTSSSAGAIAAWHGRLQEIVRSAGITGEQTVVFYEDVSGSLAAFGVWLLDAAGLGNGAILDGGIRGWHAAGSPLSQEPAIPSRSDTEISPDAMRLATLDSISASLEDETGAAQIIDARTVAEHAAGAIPGALHVDWTSHLDPATGAFRPMADIAAIYDAAGLDRDRDVSSYCAGGIRAANTYVVLRALGVKQARIYAPSWGEWGIHPETPKH